ncbi:MAG TPA: hypothetical protein VHB78_09205 [Vicinamibacterales bacterium]|jgi:hypothetical protein|nr:hypothetical protein [Vicinamibacterales bacterium]
MSLKPESKSTELPSEYQNLSLVPCINRAHMATIAVRQDATGERLREILAAADFDGAFQALARELTVGKSQARRRRIVGTLCWLTGVKSDVMKRYLKAKGILNAGD